MAAGGGGSLAEQLASALPHMRGARRTVLPACRIRMRIPADDLDGAFGEARDEVLRWMQDRAGRRLPAEAWRGEGFELAGAAPLRVEAAPARDAGRWTARLDEADGDVPDRLWATEAEIARDGEAISVHVRLGCAARGESPSAPSVPGLVRRIADRFDVAVDGRPVGAGPWLVDTPERAEKLLALLCDPERERDVLTIATHDLDDDPSTALVSPQSVFERTLGAAHVAVVTMSATFALTDRVGKELSVFRQAVRTYKPGFDPWRAEPRDHPLAVGTRISAWAGGSEAFEDFLVATCLRATVGAVDREEHPPFPFAARRTAPEPPRTPVPPATPSGDERLDALRRENEELGAETLRLAEALGKAEKERNAAIAARNEARAEARSLRDRAAYLERMQGNAPARPDGSVVPGSFGQLEQWSKEQLDGAVRLHPRAIRAAKKSKFEDVALACRALLILRDHYVPMRLEGGADRRAAYREALAREGLKDEPTFAGARAGEHGDAYNVEHGGRNRQLERHLKGSNARDERRGFRLYFFWDDSDREVVVGWLPNHLPTRIS